MKIVDLRLQQSYINMYKKERKESLRHKIVQKIGIKYDINERDKERQQHTYVSTTLRPHYLPLVAKRWSRT